MNWRIVVGLLLIFGSVKEMYEIRNDYSTAVTTSNPIYTQLAVLPLLALGVYLFFKGRSQKKIIK